MIGILAAATFVILNPVDQLQKGRDNQRKSDLSQIQKVLEQYYRDNGRYPASSTDYKIVRLDGSTAEWGAEWLPYMAKLPKDPTTSNRYAYYSTGQAYYLYAAIERGVKDPRACNAGDACKSLSGRGFPATDVCGGVCSYGVSSANVSL